MAEDNRIFIDVMRDVSTRVSELYDTENGIFPIFKFGNTKKITHELEIINQAESTRSFNFPMILLVMDNSENYGDVRNILYSTSPQVFILDIADLNASSEEWLIKAKAVLFPIYNYLLQALDESCDIRDQPNGIKHIKTDRPDIGEDGIPLRGAGKVFCDALDGIEIEFINLEIYRNKCN